MAKPDKTRWIQLRLEREKRFLDEETKLNYEAKAYISWDEANRYWNSRQRYTQQVLTQKQAYFEGLYNQIYERPQAVVERAIVDTPKIKGIERYAKTRSKAANEMFNLKYLVDEANARQFERFVRATHGRTLKKMLNNNIKFAQSQGAKYWTARAKKFIANFKGSKEELAYQFAERYGNKLSQYSSDLQLKNKGSIVRETERLTKSGKIRKRYAKRSTSHLSEIEKINRYRTLNLEKAMYRMFKIDNRGKDFDNQGNGLITQYWLNRIRDFANIPRAGLADLEEAFFESIKPMGLVGGQEFYQVKLSPQALKVLHRSRTQARTSTNKYGSAFIDLYKRQ